MKKKSDSPQAILERKLWQLCREVAQKLWPDPVKCYTCGAGPLEGSNKQLGHFVRNSTAGAFLRYDMRILRWQCGGCNKWKNGNEGEYAIRLLRDHGPEYLLQIQQDKNRITKATDRYLEQVSFYERVLSGEEKMDL